MKKKMRRLLPLAAVCLLLAGCGSTGSEENQAQAEPSAEETAAVDAKEKASAKGADEAAGAKEAAAQSEAAGEEEDMETETQQETTTYALPGARLNGDAFAAGEEPQRVTYADGFYYEPLSDGLKDYITGTSYPETADASSLAVTRDDLRYVHVLYTDFDGEPEEGELVCNAAIAQDLVEIFYELYENRYPIERIRLIDEYGGDDDASMAADNTSCFNYRNVAGSSSLSNHALGRAVDVNPLYNPYITYNADGSEHVSPPEGAAYADRSVDFDHKIDTNDLCYRLFTEHGFTWGGSWNSSRDYQHFEKEY